MNGEPRHPGLLRPTSLSNGVTISGASTTTSDNLRSRNKRRDDAIRKKVEQELSRRTMKRNSASSASGQKHDTRRTRVGTVSSLRPAPAIIIIETARIIQAAQLMAAKRTDAVLVVGEDGALAGILTDKDIAYRVVAEGLDIRTTPVSSVMTRDPIAVYDKGSRNEALNIMVSRRFRHLPVISETGGGNDDDDNEFDEAAGGTSVVGLLDITKCVFERIDDLERKVNEDLNIISAMEALERRGTVAAEHVGVVRQHHGCPDVGFVLTQTIGGQLEHGTVPEVSIKSSVRDAARIMKAYHTTAVLVIGNSNDDEQIGGIFTTKDIVLRVIAASLDPMTTSVVRVMTPHPDYVLASTSILDALKKLNTGHYLHLPVVDGGVPIGLVDVMTLTISMLTYLMTKDLGTQEGSISEDGPLWNKFWNSTFAGSTIETESDRLSQTSDSRPSGSIHYQPSSSSQHATEMSNRQSLQLQRTLSPHPDEYSSMLSRSQIQNDDPNMFTFKLKDMTRTGNGKVFRFSSRFNSLSEVYAQVCLKTGAKSLIFEAAATSGTTHSMRSEHLDLETKDGEIVRICYMDDENDVVHLESDKDVEEAVLMSRRLGLTRLMIYLGEPLLQNAVTDSQYSSGTATPNVGHHGQVVRYEDSHQSVVSEQSLVEGGNSRINPVVVYNPINGGQGRDPPASIVDYLKDAPLPVNIAISAGIIVVASYLIMKLQR
ncbi:hypothetical protein BATDEDRAFT_36036 [Batrachochytrium dendrobatidis JAM81]|uniref:CBS domain-containing protein n=2 Tax=Batrachochytrium dendrobatidis TaxID=109871 RepID=F4PBM3_BATDJ|nr:uncharacterized protein BATDEDRAFT_36036 [Batrachochytrium dendrobatidis JAM81]EGF77349.1 hypothetical protein BATDEDRAFT_36036 [Batrachochytrium dendrobatidis JAM81]KAJ8327590.1 hypothetical protein O5D80_003948 [Batrachochytrium dendrobatidis]KAK5669228.1 hypothetical protein QVD99_003640 [Batrachochytrium dendrobatidis]|eukprot:XP_006681995.1 hypothetical protein BATDEDRAFT_36036 [Batrachochytrium dendrobatidis JAM81]